MTQATTVCYITLMLKTAFEAASALIFPKVCETCQDILPLRNQHGVCAACAGTILKIKAPFCSLCGRSAAHQNALCGQCRDTGFAFDCVYAACYYEGKMRELLQAFKYGGKKPLRLFFSEILSDFISRHLALSEIDAFVSVPMETGKQNERGFNQAALLTRHVARTAGRQDLSAYFKRKKSKRSQSRLNKNERAHNITGSFFVKNREIFSGKKIVLIDDILTTGFTASECSRTLKAAGALSVTALAVARGL